MASLLLFIRAFVRRGEKNPEIRTTKRSDENTIGQEHNYEKYRRNLHFHQPVFSESYTFRDIQKEEEEAWKIDEFCI